MRVITNNLGSGDWIVVQDDQGDTIFSNHNIGVFGLMDILNHESERATLVELTDEQMEGLGY